MHGVESRAGLLPVDTGDNARRGAELKRRRNRHGFSERALAEEVVRAQGGTMDRATVKRAEIGTASPGTYDRLEAFFDDYEYQVSEDVPPREQIEVEFRNVFGIEKILYRGSPENFPTIEAAIGRLVQQERDRSRDE